MRIMPILKWNLIVAMALVFAIVAVLAAPAASSAQSPAGQESDAQGDSSAIDGGAEVEIQNRFNELRREILDDRADTIEWWLTGIVLMLALLALFFGSAGYLAFRRLREVEEAVGSNVEAARGYAEEAGRLAEEIRGFGVEADEPLRSMAGVELTFARTQIGEELSRIPGRAGASAIAEARQLENEGRLDESIERWKHIASVADGSNEELAAMAFRSIGDLSERLSRSAKR